MLEAIIAYLKAKLEVVFPEYEVKCLCDLVEKNGKTAVVEYIGTGENNALDLDAAKGTIYFRRNGDVSTEELDDDDEAASCDGLERHTIPLKVVLYANKEALGDNSFSEGKLAENLRKALRVNDDGDLRITLQADSIQIRTLRHSTDRQSIAQAELRGINVRTGYERVLIAVEIEAEVTSPPSCFEYWTCNDERVSFNNICPAVSVRNSDGSYSQTVEAGGNLVIENISVTDGNGNVADYPGAVDIEVPECLPVTVQNSDASFSAQYASGSNNVLDDIEVTDGNGNTAEYPAAKNLAVPACLPATVKNSTNSYNQSVASGGTHIIPDVVLTEADGSTTTHPYSAAISAIQIPFVYAYTRPTGQTTSYATGDDAYIFNLYFSNLPAGRNNQLASFTTLLNNNSFGNKNRFTGPNGGQNFTDNYLIDNFTGLGWYTVAQSSVVWATGIANARAASIVVNGITYNDWFMPNVGQMVSLFNYENLGAVLNYAPFNILVNLNTSTTINNSGSNYRAAANGSSSAASKITAANYLLCRKHF